MSFRDCCADEFNRLAKTQTRFSGLTIPSWIEVLPSPHSLQPEIIQSDLDPGGSAAIALCLQEKADVLLIDEFLGREVAEKLKVRTVGILGILLDARNLKLISSVKDLMKRLEAEANFWISPALKLHILQLAGE